MTDCFGHGIVKIWIVRLKFAIRFFFFSLPFLLAIELVDNECGAVNNDRTLYIMQAYFMHGTRRLFIKIRNVQAMNIDMTKCRLVGYMRPHFCHVFHILVLWNPFCFSYVTGNLHLATYTFPHSKTVLLSWLFAYIYQCNLKGYC